MQKTVGKKLHTQSFCDDISFFIFQINEITTKGSRVLVSLGFTSRLLMFTSRLLTLTSRLLTLKLHCSEQLYSQCPCYVCFLNDLQLDLPGSWGEVAGMMNGLEPRSIQKPRPQ